MIAVALALATTAPDRIDLRPTADIVVSSVALVSAAIPELFKNQIAAGHCRLCDGPDNLGLPGTGSQGSLNGVDAWFHDATAGWLLPRQTAAVVAESGLVSLAVMQGVKYVAVRKRPFVRYGNGDTSGIYSVYDADSRLSLPSGHTALATALGVSLATTATLEESTVTPWLWVAAAFGSVTTATLRMTAEKHYFTDVVAGAAIGAACGVVIPLMHRRGGALSSDAVSVAAQGPALSVSGRF